MVSNRIMSPYHVSEKEFFTFFFFFAFSAFHKIEAEHTDLEISPFARVVQTESSEKFSFLEILIADVVWLLRCSTFSPSFTLNLIKLPKTGSVCASVSGPSVSPDGKIGNVHCE